jgi:hypothetical protein
MPSKGILDGIRVLEIGHAVAGPAAGLILLDLEAEVIKVEKPSEGDLFRNLLGMGQSVFMAINRADLLPRPRRARVPHPSGRRGLRATPPLRCTRRQVYGPLPLPLSELGVMASSAFIIAPRV